MLSELGHVFAPVSSCSFCAQYTFCTHASVPRMNDYFAIWQCKTRCTLPQRHDVLATYHFTRSSWTRVVKQPLLLRSCGRDAPSLLSIPPSCLSQQPQPEPTPSLLISIRQPVTRAITDSDIAGVRFHLQNMTRRKPHTHTHGCTHEASDRS